MIELVDAGRGTCGIRTIGPNLKQHTAYIDFVTLDTSPLLPNNDPLRHFTFMRFGSLHVDEERFAVSIGDIVQGKMGVTRAVDLI